MYTVTPMSIQDIRQVMIDLQYLKFETWKQIEEMELIGEDAEKERVRAMKYDILIDQLAEYISTWPTDHSLD
jgi:hypothetical protein